MKFTPHFRLAKITSTAEERRNVTHLYHRSTLHSLMVMVPGIDWFRYLEIVTNRVIKLDDTVVIFAMKYLEVTIKSFKSRLGRKVSKMINPLQH